MRVTIKTFLSIFSILIICFIACTDKSEEGQKEVDQRLGNWANEIKLPQYCDMLEKHIKRSFVQQDTLLLGYVLGWNEKQVIEYTNSLVSAGTISPRRREFVPTFTIGKRFTAWDTISTWHGYDYSFQLNTNSRCYGFINFAYDQDSLSYLCFFIMPQISIDEMKEFLSKKYGVPDYQTYIHEDDVDPKRMFVWLHGGKEIQLCEWLNHIYVQYSDIKKRLREEKLLIQTMHQKNKNDSIGKEYLKKQAENSPKVF